MILLNKKVKLLIQVNYTVQFAKPNKFNRETEQNYTGKIQKIELGKQERENQTSPIQSKMFELLCTKNTKPNIFK